MECDYFYENNQKKKKKNIQIKKGYVCYFNL